MRKHGTPIADRLREALEKDPTNTEAIVAAIAEVERASYEGSNAIHGAAVNLP